MLCEPSGKRILIESVAGERNAVICEKRRDHRPVHSHNPAAIQKPPPVSADAAGSEEEIEGGVADSIWRRALYAR